MYCCELGRQLGVEVSNALVSAEKLQCAAVEQPQPTVTHAWRARKLRNASTVH